MSDTEKRIKELQQELEEIQDELEETQEEQSRDVSEKDEQDVATDLDVENIENNEASQDDAEDTETEDNQSSWLRDRLGKTPQRRRISKAIIGFIVVILGTVAVLFFANQFLTDKTGTVTIALAGVSDTTIDIENDITVSIDESVVTTNKQGILEFTGDIGTHMLTISSPHYIDQSHEIEVYPDIDREYSYDLTPAADATISIVDFVSEQQIQEFLVAYTDREITTTNGSVTITDIALDSATQFVFAVNAGESYAIKVFDTLSVAQGLNTFKNLVVPPKGNLIYVSAISGSPSIYSTLLDGSRIEKLTDDSGDDINPFQSADGMIYFLSDRGVPEGDKQTTNYWYMLNPQTKQLQKVTKTDYDDNNGYVGEYDLASFTRMYTDFKNNGQYWGNPLSELYRTNLDGTNVKKVSEMFSRTGYYASYRSAPDQSYSVYVKGGYNDTDLGLYRISSKDGSHTKIFAIAGNETATIEDISSDSQYVLIQVSDFNGNLDLWKIGVWNGITEKLTNNSAPEYNALISPDTMYVTYVSTRDSVDYIFRKQFAKDSTEELVATLGNASAVKEYYWHPQGFIVFYKENNLHIVFPKQGNVSKKVIDSVDRSSFVWDSNQTSYYGYGY